MVQCFDSSKMVQGGEVLQVQAQNVSKWKEEKHLSNSGGQAYLVIIVFNIFVVAAVPLNKCFAVKYRSCRFIQKDQVVVDCLNSMETQRDLSRVSWVHAEMEQQ